MLAGGTVVFLIVGYEDDGERRSANAAEQGERCPRMIPFMFQVPLVACGSSALQAAITITGRAAISKKTDLHCAWSNFANTVRRRRENLVSPKGNFYCVTS